MPTAEPFTPSPEQVAWREQFWDSGFWEPMPGAFMAMWSLFINPGDAPGCVVLRRFDIYRGDLEPRPSTRAMFASVEVARWMVRPDKAKMMRHPTDVPCLAETYM